MQCKICNSDLKLVAGLNKNNSDSNKLYILEWWQCKSCKAVFFVELTHYKNDESIEHAVYLSQQNRWEDEVTLALSCPKKQQNDCHCKAHKHNFNYDYKKLVSYFISK